MNMRTISSIPNLSRQQFHRFNPAVVMLDSKDISLPTFRRPLPEDSPLSCTILSDNTAACSADALIRDTHFNSSLPAAASISISVQAPKITVRMFLKSSDISPASTSNDLAPSDRDMFLFFLFFIAFQGRSKAGNVEGSGFCQAFAVIVSHAMPQDCSDIP